jgi:hypothetical protein
MNEQKSEAVEAYSPCEVCYGCECCNDCQRCYTCQVDVDMPGRGFDDTFNEFNPPDVEDFIRAECKEDGHIWLTLPRWLDKIVRTLFGWWLKSPPKER